MREYYEYFFKPFGIVWRRDGFPIWSIEKSRSEPKACCIFLGKLLIRIYYGKRMIPMEDQVQRIIK